MGATAENGFWDTVRACETRELRIEHRHLPLLRLFFHSGRNFPLPDGAAWRRSLERLTLHRHPRKRP